MFAYLGGVAIAVIVFDFAARAWPADPFARFMLGWWTASNLFSVIIGWLAALTPFLATRRWTKRRAFEGPALSVVSGVLVILLAYPIYLWMVRAVSIGGPSYATQFTKILFAYWPILIASGATFGLSYWAIERWISPRIEAGLTRIDTAIKEFNDAPPDRKAKLRARWLRRAAVLAGCWFAVVLVLALRGRVW